MEAWASVIDCWDCKAFPKCVERFECACLAWSLFLEYVQKTWIKLHKEKFVRAWTNKVMHVGNTTSNRYDIIFFVYLYVNESCVIWSNFVFVCRVEQAHGNLKQILQTKVHVGMQ